MFDYLHDHLISEGKDILRHTTVTFQEWKSGVLQKRRNGRLEEEPDQRPYCIQELEKKVGKKIVVKAETDRAGFHRNSEYYVKVVEQDKTEYIPISEYLKSHPVYF